MTDMPPTDPSRRGGSWRDRYDAARARGVALDPTSEPVPGVNAYPTQYVRTSLLITDGEHVSALFADIGGAAAELGWKTDLRTIDDRPADIEEAAARARRARAAFDLPTIYRVLITPSFDRPDTPDKPDGPDTPDGPDGQDKPDKPKDRQPVPPVDAWRLLQRLRVRAGGPDKVDGVSLEHVVGVDSFYGKTNPFDGGVESFYGKTNSPMTSNAPGTGSYGYPGSGGRQVVAFAGAAPARSVPLDDTGRRPVVAVLDTGCGEHTWFAGVTRRYPAVDGTVIGLSDPATDPETHPDQAGPMDGELDPAAGHGTFVSGMIRQTGPEADLVVIRVADSMGTVLEGDFLLAIRRLVTWMQLGEQIDVVNMSLGYYHETPDEERFDRTLIELLLRIRRLGCAIVCSAGNDATDRPAFPAALWGWDGADFVVDDPDDIAPHISVGALNPNGSVALFSNLGPWVRVWAPGAAVMSTLPDFRGGVQAGSWNDRTPLARETIDPDDYSGGFAIWSGTSFAAPYVSGMLAQSLAAKVMAGPVSAADRSTALRDGFAAAVKELRKKGPRDRHGVMAP